MLLDPLLAQLTAAAMGGQPAPTLSLEATASRSTEVLPGNDGDIPQEQKSLCATSFDVFGMPAIQDSLAALKSTTKHGRTIEPDAIQALGVSIAAQVAKFMGTRGRPLSMNRRERKRKDRTWDFPELPIFKQRKTVPQPSRHVPQFIAAVSPTEPEESLWGPARRPYARKRKRDPSPDHRYRRRCG